MIRFRNYFLVSIVFFSIILRAQAPPVAVPPGYGPRPDPRPASAIPVNPPPQPAPAAQPPAGQPGAPAATAPQQPAGPAPVVAGGLNLQNVSLTEVIDILARQMKMNYILDPRVKGVVFLNTYGEVKAINSRSLLEMILRINGFGMVQVGDVFRIVPLTDIGRLPLPPQVNPSSIPEDDRTSLNLIFLKYASADELSKLLEPFTGENAKMFVYSPANMLLLMDSNRSMRRTMELIALFDNDTFTSQRVKLLDVKNSRPSDLAKEMDHVFKSVSLSEKNAPIKFIGLDRINTLIVVASNPTVFAEVEKWMAKLDVAVKITAGSVDNYVYRVRYGRADAMAGAIMALYMGNIGFGMGGGMGGGYGGFGGGMGGYGGGMGGYGGGMGGYGGGMGGYGGGMGGYGGGMGGGYGGYGSPGYGTSPSGTPSLANSPYLNPLAAGAAQPAAAAGSASPTDLTGSYLGAAGGGMRDMSKMPRVIPNPFDNTLLIQADRQEYEGIVKLLKELDVPPRQVLIDARIYEVTLGGSFASGVTAYLATRDGSSAGGSAPVPPTRQILGSLIGSATNFSVGTLVGQSRQLLAFVQLQENTTRVKVVSAPSIIATDSIPATINVGTEVPTLTSTAATGSISGGNTQFAQTVQSRSSGVTLNVLARINPSGIVTLVINQEVSTPVPPAPGSINSPSFAKRSIQTQITMEDGDMIAIAGIIDEKDTFSSGGIPLLHRIPGLGALFGSRSYGKERTELIIFMSPRVIYDTTQLAEASDELKSRLKKLQKIVKE